MVDEELVRGGEEGSAKVAPVPDTSPTEGKTMMDAEPAECESQFALFLVLIASVVLVVATGAAYDWDIRVSKIVRILSNPLNNKCVLIIISST